MVVFTCNACGQSLKKNQVEKHYTSQCKKCECLSCMDCGKDFWGNEYESHTKCITEEEKYSGKNYKESPNARKGEKKQEMWIQHLQQVIVDSPNEKLQSRLQQLLSFENIPRKKSKFFKFMKNSMNIDDDMVQLSIWEVFDEAHSTFETSNGTEANGEKKAADEDVTADPSQESGSSKKKKHKRKHAEIDAEDAAAIEDGVEGSSKKKKEKRDKNVEAASTEMEVDQPSQSNEEPQSSKKKKHKKKKSEADMDSSLVAEDETPAAPLQEVTNQLESNEEPQSSSKKKHKKKKSKSDKDSSLVADDDETPAAPLQEVTNQLETPLVTESNSLSESKKKKKKKSKKEDEETADAALVESAQNVQEPLENGEEKEDATSSSHKKKKKKHASADAVVDTPSAESLKKAEKKARKHKHDAHVGDDIVTTPNVARTPSSVENPLESFPWKKCIKKYISEQEPKVLSFNTLKRKVFEDFKTASTASGSPSMNTQFCTKLKEVLTSKKYVFEERFDDEKDTDPAALDESASIQNGGIHQEDACESARKKKKKQQHADVESEKVAKKARKLKQNVVCPSQDTSALDEFPWNKIIKEYIVSQPTSTINMHKLKKKVFNEFSKATGAKKMTSSFYKKLIEKVDSKKYILGDNRLSLASSN